MFKANFTYGLNQPIEVFSTPNVHPSWLCVVCHPKRIWQCTKTFLSIVIMVIMTCIISAFLLIGIWILERWASAMSSKGQRGKKSWAAGRARKGEKEEVQARKSQHPLWLGPEGTTCVATRPTITASIFTTITASQLLCGSSLPHLNCSANQQTSLKQFDLVRCWRYSQNAAAKFPAEGEEGEDQREGSLPTRELPTTLLISLPPSSAPRTRSLTSPAPNHQHRTFLKSSADYWRENKNILSACFGRVCKALCEIGSANLFLIQQISKSQMSLIATAVLYRQADT